MTRRHLLLMTVGCIVPIVALSAILLFQIQISTVLLLGLFLLCPLLHLWMMRDHIGQPSHLPDRPNMQAPFRHYSRPVDGINWRVNHDRTDD